MTTVITKQIRFSTGEVKEMTFEEVRKRFYPTLKKEVRRTNNKLIYNKIEEEDYLQELELELWRGFNDYDIDAGTCFSTYLSFKLQKGTRKSTYHRYSKKNQCNGIVSSSAPVGDDDLKLEDMFKTEGDSSDDVMYEALVEVIQNELEPGEEELLAMIVDIKNNPVKAYADKHEITRQAANQRLVKFKSKLQDSIKLNYFI